MMSPDWLKTAARRSSEEAWMLGHVFERYRVLEGLSEDALAAELGCTVDTLHWMSFCRRPEGEAFAEHASLIAKRFEVDLTRLVAVLRRVEVMEALSARSRDEAAAVEERLLLAARDRSDDEEMNS